MVRYTLEVCVDSVESAKAAVRAGANRLEICSCISIGGGTTPSCGLVQAIRDACPGISLMVMIRPRCGDFVYSEDELNVMILDIRSFKALAVEGIVVGILTPDGDVDVQRTTKLVQEANPLQVTFHRAFDMTHDLKQAFVQVTTILGISRVLTSGGNPTVVDSLPLLGQLLATFPSGPAIMVGSGVSPSTINTICTSLVPHGLQEVHMSGAEWISGEMNFKKPGMGMSAVPDREWDIWRSSTEKIQHVREVLDTFFSS